MKALIFGAIVFAQVSASAATIYCGGRDPQDETYQIVIDQSEGTIALNKQITERGGMPPYPFVPVESYRITEDNSHPQQLNVKGVSTRMTTGTSGRIAVEGWRTRTVTPVRYVGEVTITPTSRLVVPVASIKFSVNCEARNEDVPRAR